MKKLITVIAFFVVLISVTHVINYASGAEDKVASISVQTYPTKTVYGAFEEFDPTGLTLRVRYENGSERVVFGEQVGVVYMRDDCLRVGDNSVTLYYGGARTSIPVTVNRIAYDLSVLDLNSFSVTYNGKYQSYSKMLPTIIGQDGIPLIMSAVGGSVNAGSYDIKLDFYTESLDYILPDTRVVTMTILPYRPEVVWSELSFTYDGRSKLPEAYYYDVNGNKIYPTVSGAAINAGSYTAFASVNDSNYLLSGAEVNYEIKKADYDFSGVKWSDDSFVYTGGKKSISATGLPEGVSIIGYTGDRAIGAGKYTAVASLSWDERNYNPPPELSHQWEILPAEYDMSHTLFVDSEFTYDGEIHYPRLEGRMPTGADGITLDYSFSKGALHVSDGAVNVTVTFSTESPNYTVPASQSATVKIAPKGVTVKWGEKEIYYSGEYNHPSVSAEECEIKVDGGGVNVGKYLATATTDNTDYYILNEKMEFVICKATNVWTQEPDDSVCYEGRNIALLGKSKFGVVNYLFFSDDNGENRINSPTSCGVYYARLFVPETDNYSGLESEIISFEIVEIVAVSFEVEIKTESIKAFNALTPDDFVCYIVNNDGSSESVDSSLVKVAYENADTFLRIDNRVDFIYDKFHISLPVSVGYADYDLSGVIWEETSPDYDGSPKSPFLSGLPEGVIVIEYLGAEVTDAGKYKVTAVLEYDRENYNEPIISTCDFEIRKRSLDTPVISAVYNGRAQMPLTDSPLYTIVYDGKYTNAGSYGVRAVLTDDANYVFSASGSAECEAVFRILPKTIPVTVSDVRKHLFEKLPTAEYTLNEAEIIEGDRLTITQYREGNYLYLSVDNPNYTLSVSPGKIIRLWYPTAKGAIVILIIFLAIDVILLLAFLAYKYRSRITEAFAVMRCRWHNRSVEVNPPTYTPSGHIPDVFSFAAENEMKREEVEREEAFNEIQTQESEDFSSEKDEMTAEENPPKAPTAPIDNIEDFHVEISPVSVDAERADRLITDSLAKNLIKKDAEIIFTSGSGKGIINVDTLSDNFAPGERVDVNCLKQRGLVSQDVSHLKVLARGSVDKALSVYANDFSLAAVKMIALTGGEAIKIITMKEKNDDN